LAGLVSADARITVHLGRIEPHPAVLLDLRNIATRHAEAVVFVEKAVDVSLAIDFVTFAMSDRYDAAYLLTADGDYTPAVEAVRKLNKKVYAASCQSGARLAGAVNSFIRLRREWFQDCYR
jgi:uncharacterized LabA/DUF88 family protein